MKKLALSVVALTVWLFSWSVLAGYASVVILTPSNLIYNGKQLSVVYDDTNEVVWLRNLGLFTQKTMFDIQSILDAIVPASGMAVSGYDFSGYGSWRLAREEEVATLIPVIDEDWSVFPYTRDELSGMTYYKYWIGRIADVASGSGASTTRYIYRITSYSNMSGNVYTSGGRKGYIADDAVSDPYTSAWILAKRGEGTLQGVVPEPASLYLLGLAFPVLFSFRRRRR